MKKKTIIIFFILLLSLGFLIFCVNIFFYANYYIEIGEDKYCILSKSIVISPKMENVNYDFKQLSKCKNLNELYLFCNCDVNLEFLYYIPNIEKLGIMSPTYIESFEYLGCLNNLKYCCIDGVGLSSTEPFEMMSELQTLIISNNPIEDISYLNGLKKLRTLSICNTNVKDISGLKKLSNLENIYILDCQIEDYTPLLECEKMQKIYTDKNQLNDKLKEELANKGISVIETQKYIAEDY